MWSRFRTPSTHTRALTLAVAVALTAPVVARAATTLPPREDKSVYDVAGVIEPADEAAFERRHVELYEKTGVAIVVLTVPQLVDETIDQLAVRAGTMWGVGQRGQDRGLVIALARDDRKIFVATGYGTEEYLPDGKVGAILDRDAVPLLRQNEFSRALSALDAALVAESASHYGVTLTGMPERPVEKSHGSNIPTLIGLAVLVLVAMRFPWLLMWFGGGFGGFGRRGGRGNDGGGFGGFGGGGFGGGGAGRDF